MKKFSKIAIATVVVVAAGVTAFGVNAGWGEHRGFCGRGDMPGPSPMMMKSMRGHGPFVDRDLNLTAEEAKTVIEARLIMHGKDRLKVGKVTQKDDNTYLVDIVTVDESLAHQVEIDRSSGLPRGRMGGMK